MPLDETQHAHIDEAYEWRARPRRCSTAFSTCFRSNKRAGFTLFELDGRTCEEIAQLCAIPIGTVYSRLRLARETFKRASARLEARERFAGGGT